MEVEGEVEQFYDTSTLKEESQAVAEPPMKREQSQAMGGNTPQSRATNPMPAPRESVKIEAVKEQESVVQQKPSPRPADNKENILQTIGLGINNTDLGDNMVVGHDADNAAINSPFDMPNESDNNDNPALNFDAMDFSLHDSSTEHPNTKEENNDFDLSTFGNAQDFNVPESNANIPTTSGDAMSIPPAIAQEADAFGMNTASGDDNMDLDLDLGIAGEDSMFDDLFTASGDYDAMGDGDDMRHGEFDSEFFGLS